ncbi:hypothetical protein [Rivularia sp. UHCC 0363]|uniref:hypothetical protein n=1 Tax=Rivularia sp. UHCC 0363 TaxID=3110244 RepID=UPI002B200C21|nr:hypothetical protein [Rivularia sp. UHCC 0363]MEA5597717.1 hypothetical protein [Rivularia sp. UHCC 0363]
MTVGSADRQKPTQKLDELLAQKTHKVNSLVSDTLSDFERNNIVCSVTHQLGIVIIS